MYESTCVPIEAVAILQPVTALCLRDRHYWMNFKLILEVPFVWKSQKNNSTYFPTQHKWKQMEISVLLSRSLDNTKRVFTTHYTVSSYLVIQLLRPKSHFALIHRPKYPLRCKVCMYAFLVYVPSFPNYHSNILQGQVLKNSSRYTSLSICDMGVFCSESENWPWMFIVDNRLENQSLKRTKGNLLWSKEASVTY